MGWGPRAPTGVNGSRACSSYHNRGDHLSPICPPRVHGPRISFLLQPHHPGAPGDLSLQIPPPCMLLCAGHRGSLWDSKNCLLYLLLFYFLLRYGCVVHREGS